jgi:hypothetical protein
LATIADAVAAYMRGLGYPARAHVLTNYQVLPVPIAIQAGTGELGRHGVMITKELGSALKLATVTTDLPLVYDEGPRGLGVSDFCEDRKLCAESCPWNHEKNWFHRLTTAIAMRKHKAGWWMSHAEKLVYGSFKPADPPGWFEKPERNWKKYRRLG